MAKTKKLETTQAPAKKTMEELAKELALDPKHTTPLRWFPLGRDIGICALSFYGGKWALDIRRHYVTDSEEIKPTAKGIRIPLEDAPEIIAVLHHYFSTGEVEYQDHPLGR